MDFNKELDSLIEKYSGELIKLGEQYGYMKEESREEYEDDGKSEEITLTDKAENVAAEQPEESLDGNLYSRQETSVMPENVREETEETNGEKESEKEISPYPLESPENYATFKAVIFTAQGALPVEGAKITVKRKDELHAFLITNGSGETKTVKLEAYPERNSLEPLNPDKQMLYTADIKADGFEDKTDLPVYATGGSQIILQEYLVPTGGM